MTTLKQRVKSRRALTKFLNAIVTDPVLEMPKLANMGTEDVNDLLGLIKAQLKVLKKLEAYFKEAAFSRRDIKAYERDGFYTMQGANFVTAIEHREQTRFDSAAAKEEMGDEWYEEHSKTIEFDVTTVRELPEEPTED